MCVFKDISKYLRCLCVGVQEGGCDRFAGGISQYFSQVTDLSVSWYLKATSVLATLLNL